MEYDQHDLRKVLQTFADAGNRDVEVKFSDEEQETFKFCVRGGDEISRPSGMSDSLVQFYITQSIKDGLLRGQPFKGGNFGQVSITLAGLKELSELRKQTCWAKFVRFLGSTLGFVLTHIGVPILVSLATYFVLSQATALFSNPTDRAAPAEIGTGDD